MSDTQNRINFTKAALENLPLPTKGWKYYYDTKVRGLAVGVGASGIKTYVLYKKIKHRPERIKIGRVADLTVDEARRKAEQLNGEVAKNENPADNKRNLRDSLTFAQMFGRYHAEHCFPHKKTAKEDQTKFDKYLSNRDHGINLAKIKLCELTKADVRKLFDGIGKDHPITANRVLALVSSIMSDAIRDGFYEKINPCKGIKRFKENQRKRFIHPEEFPVFVKALEACTSDVTRDYIWMSLFTGARRSNVLQMKWEDVHLLRRVWRIPDTKNGESQDVPLVEQAVEILRRRFESKTGKYVFPGTGKAGYLTEPKKAWKTIITKAGMSDLRIHDLRRTFGAYQAGTGANLAVIATSLNHKSLKTTQVYARLWPNAVRSAANTAINEMFSAIRGESANDEILEVQALE